jgi:hypothetical protein
MLSEPLFIIAACRNHSHACIPTAERKKVYDTDVREYVARSQAEVAMKVTVCLGAVKGAGCNLGVPCLVAGGEAKTANELSQHLCSVLTATLREISELVAVKGLSKAVTLLFAATSACPAIAIGEEGAHPHADAGGVLE